MLSKNRTRFINSLKLKKNRRTEQLFIVEGAKNVQELLLSDYNIHSIYSTDSFLRTNSKLISKNNVPVIEVKSEELEAAGTFQTNKAALALAKIKENIPQTIEKGEYAILLDDIRDPGNLGTILRIADWYGIRKVVASLSCVDLYNPKVINASMGSFTRVNVYFTDLPYFMRKNPGPYYGTYMDGDNVNNIRFYDQGYIIIGNESNGIDHLLSDLVDYRIAIPRYGEAESLNAGVATAIVCDNLRRSIAP
jgi:TrmH family RNA methyltransferase